MSARILRGLAAAAVAVVVSGSGVAVAGQDTLPPGTLTLGPVRITPSLLLQDMGVDNNVFNEPVDTKSDFTFTITPRADIAFRMRRLRLGYNLTTDYVYYKKYTSERGTNTASSARLDFDLGRFKPYGTIQGLNTKSRLNSEVDTRARHHDVTYGAGVAFRIASRTDIVVNGTQAKMPPRLTGVLTLAGSASRLASSTWGAMATPKVSRATTAMTPAIKVRPMASPTPRMWMPMITANRAIFTGQPPRPKIDSV